MGKARAICGAAAMLGFAHAAGAAGLDLDKIAGRYVVGFTNGNVEGGRYHSEDLLEIVKIAPDAVYFRTHLEFFNGHECELSGVAEVSGPSLIYRDPPQQCELRLDVAGGKITFDDKDYHCREQSCGMRGGYSGAAFKLSLRRPICDRQKLLGSSDYADALKAYEARKQQ